MDRLGWADAAQADATAPAMREKKLLLIRRDDRAVKNFRNDAKVRLLVTNEVTEANAELIVYGCQSRKYRGTPLLVSESSICWSLFKAGMAVSNTAQAVFVDLSEEALWATKLPRRPGQVTATRPVAIGLTASSGNEPIGGAGFRALNMTAAITAIPRVLG